MKILGTKKVDKKSAMLMNSLIPYISFLDLFNLPFGQSIVFVLKKLN
jgi:hypothetical protein